MNFKKVRVRTEETIIKRTTQTIELDFDFTQLYDCFYTLTFGLKSPRSFQLLFYVLKETADNNLAISNKLYERFNAELIAHDGKGVTMQTFYNCIKELEQAKILSRISRGQYYLNPHVLWKDNVEKRTNLIISDPLDNNKVAFNPVKLLPAPKEE